METLAAQRRQPGEQGLADQLVRELGADVVAGGGRRHQAGALGLIKGVQESVFAKVAADRREQPKVEEVTDDGGLQQGPPGVLAKALEPPSDDQPDAFWHIQFGDVEVGSPPSAGIEDQPGLGEVLEDLLEEEWVALGLGVDRSDQGRRRGCASERLQHPTHVGFG